MKLKMHKSAIIVLASLLICPCQATPTLDSAQGAPGGNSLTLPSGSQLYVFAMAAGGFYPSSSFAAGQSIQILNACCGNLGVELAATTSNDNSYTTGCFYYSILGFGASSFNYAQGFYAANPGPSAHSASVQFTLDAPALVVLIGGASSQQYLTFSGLPNLVTDVPYNTVEATGIAHATLEPGTYTAQETSLDTVPDQTPTAMVDLLGVLIFSDQPNAATSSNPQIPLPTTFQPPQTPSSVNGQVLDPSGQPVSGVSLQLGTDSTTSDAQGNYSFSPVAVGSYTLTASKDGYVTASYPVSVVAGSSVQRPVTLYPANPPGALPEVKSVVSKYPDASYYLDGQLFNDVQFTANIDWGTNPPGTVLFITPRKTYTVDATGQSVSQTLSMGQDFGPNGRLRVVAVSSNGTQSPSKFAGLVVMPSPFPIPLVWGFVDEGNAFHYDTTLGISFITNAVPVPSDILLFGGSPMKMTFAPEADFEIDSDGSAKITVHGIDFGTENKWGKEPADFNSLLSGLLKKGFDTSQLPKSSFGGYNLSFYPMLGGGATYHADVGEWQYNALVGLGGDFSIQDTFPFPPFPLLYAKVKFDLPVEATAQILQISPLYLNGEIDLKPSLRGSLGVGISEIASAEGWVQGTLDLDLTNTIASSGNGSPTAIKDASISLQAGATIYYLIGSSEWSLQPVTWDIYGSSPSLSSRLAMKPVSGWHALGRDYLNYPSSGIMGKSLVKPSFFGSGGGGANPEILMSPAYPFCDPNCSANGTHFYLVFLEDNTNRTSLNRTMAMFSEYDGTMWSAPVAIADDGTADFHPRILTFADGSAVAAWENEAIEEPDTATVTNMESNLEIATAWFDPASQIWQPMFQMTTNDFLDRSPKLAGPTPDNVLLTWIANPANDINGSSSTPNQIRTAQWNGSQWSAPQMVATVSNAIVRYDLAYDGTNANLVISVDTVDNSTNANGHELFLVTGQNGSWGTPVQLTSDQVPDDNPQLALDSQGDVLLTWLKGAELSSVVNFDMADRQVVRTNQYSSNLADFKLVASSDGKLTMLWAEPSENDSDLYAVMFDPLFQVWGSPRQLTHDPQTERDKTAAYYGTNEVIAVYDRSLVSSTNSADTTLSDLAAFYYVLDEDMALDTNFIYSVPANPGPGRTAALNVRVLNLGDKAETNVVVAFYLGAAQPASEIGRLTITNTIPPQRTNDVTYMWLVPPTNSSPVTVFAVVDPDNTIPDISRSNNIAQLNLVEPEAEIQSMNWSAVGSNQLAVTVHIVNNGVVSNGIFTVSLNQDSPTGTNLFSQAVAGLAPGESTDVTFIWNVAGLPDNLNVFGVLSGAGISNNVSTANTTSSLTINQVLPPWLGDLQYLTNGSFQLAVYGNANHACTLQVSSNLFDWQPLTNIMITSPPFYFTDSSATNPGSRFYRAAVP